LIGIILGLAIYNSIILDLRFPFVIYKKLLKQKPTLGDLKAISPGLGYSLQKLLDYQGNVEIDLDLNHQITIDRFGSLETVDLVRDGAIIPVTNDNRKEYVDLYVKYIMEDSIAKQYNAFSKGFFLVCGGPVFNLFRPEELELIIIGSYEDPNFEELEKVTKYDGGLTKDSRVVRNFWYTMNHEMNLQQKKKLLSFVTGSDRIPIRGLGSLQFIIQGNGPDSNRLPTAYTCYNILLLPNYSTKEKLREKLFAAIEVGNLGFGLK